MWKCYSVMWTTRSPNNIFSHTYALLDFTKTFALKKRKENITPQNSTTAVIRVIVYTSGSAPLGGQCVAQWIAPGSDAFRTGTDLLTLAVVVVLGELEARSALACDASFRSFPADMSTAVVFVHAGRAFLCPIHTHCRTKQKHVKATADVGCLLKVNVISSWQE